MSNEKPVPGESTPQEESKKTASKRPVVVYIMILFIAAFLLMALSFAMHQRSNQEALGELETSFNTTIQEIQASQERLLELEKELDAANDQLYLIQLQATDANAALLAAELEADAMEALYVLQQKYSAGLYQECLTLAEQMEANGLAKALSPIPIISETGGTVTAPYNRYLQLKEASLEKLAYNTES